MYSDPFDYSEYRSTASWLLLLLALGGLIARVLLILHSWGTDDVDLWWRFAESIHRHGLFAIYEREVLFHYPLLTGLFIHGAYQLSESADVSFPILLRLPGVLADCAITVLLYRLLLPYGFRRAAWGAAAYGGSAIAIVLTGYHGAIEPLYVFLSFTAFVLLEAHGRPGMAGFFLGLACNLKLLPLLLFPALLTGCRSLRESITLAIGVALGASPLLYGAWELGPLFLNQVLFFDPGQSDWNPDTILTPLLSLWPALSVWKDAILSYHLLLGRSILVACLTALALGELLHPNRTPLHVAAISFCLFLLFAPGFRVEYCLLGAAFFSATLPPLSLGFGLIAGSWAASSYISNSIGAEIWRSVHTGPPVWITLVLGLTTWIYTAYMLYKLWRIEDLHQEERVPFFEEDDFM